MAKISSETSNPSSSTTFSLASEEKTKILKRIKFLLKNQGMTIKGAKKALNSSASLKLDDSSNQFITTNKKNLDLKNKITNISKLIKEIKSLK